MSVTTIDQYLKRISFLVLLLGLSFTAFSQEICDNGIDDDNDGLIDLNDSDDCSCNLYSTTPQSLIPNPSFEDTICCPTGSSQMNCASDWVQASDATSDYFNLCGYSQIVNPPNYPIPDDGSGYTGIINDSAYAEYVGACLNSPMIAGTSYTLNFYTALSTGDFVFDFSLFGTPTCGDLPWSGTSCPVGSGQWQELASQNISFNTIGEWQMVSLTFTPTIDIAAVALGGGCGSQGMNNFNYYYIDGLYLDSTVNFGAWIEGNGGNLCENDLILTASTIETGGTWQWYQDGVALPGETMSTLDISTYGPGNFSAVYSNSDGCVVANGTWHQVLYPQANFSAYLDPCSGVLSLSDESTITNGGIINDVDWYFSDNSSALDVFDTTHILSPPVTLEVMHVVNSVYGCSDTSYQTFSFDFSISADIISNVNESTYMASQGDTINMCFDNNDTIDVSGIANVSAPHTITDYQWAFDFGDITDTQDTSHFFPTSGFHYMNLTVTASNGCTAGALQPVWIHELPEASFVFTDGIQSYQSLSNDTLHFCPGDTLMFFNTSTYGPLDTISQYFWNFGNGDVYFDEDTILVYDTPGIYDVVLYVSTDYSCDDRDSVVIVINDTHAEVVNINFETCLGANDGSATITNFSGAYSGDYVVSVFDPDGNLFADGTFLPGDDFPLSNLYTGVWTVNIENNIGCSWDTTFTIQSIEPPINISTNIGHPQCFATPTGSLTAFSTNPGTFSFTISDSDGNIVNVPGTNTANSLEAGTYTVSIVDNSNCYSEIQVQLIDPPAIDINLDLVHPLCHGFETGSALVDTIYNTQGDYSQIDYNWDPNPLGSNGLNQITNTGLVAGEYILEITDEIGCTRRITYHIIDPNPLVGVMEVVSPTFCRTAGYQKGNGEVTVTTAGLNQSGTGNVTYHWENLENGDTSDNSTFVVNVPGWMAVTLEDDNGCIYTNTIYVDSVNPISDFELLSEQFEGPGEYEGTEHLEIELINQSTNFSKESYELSDSTFRITWFNNETGNENGNWFFRYDYNLTKTDTILTGEQKYEVCLVAKNFNDCRDTLCKIAEVHAFPELEIPNVFTPGASPNNTFFFPNRGIDLFNATVFNRYGIEVFRFETINDHWNGDNLKNGKPCLDGIYFYTYSATSTNGTHFSGQGNVHLIRGDK